MTDYNDTIKGLECCICDECESCPHDEETVCVENLHQEAVDLIKSYKSEIERLEANLKEALAEIEALKQINLHCESEVTKKFAEWLKEYLDDFYHTEEDGLLDTAELIDSYVKERVGES